MSDTADLLDVLADSQRLGFLGDRPIEDVVEHARRFVAALEMRNATERPSIGTVLDLGAGGGVPGLVIADERPDLHVILLDRRSKRTDFLERSIRRLGWAARASVYAGEAESFARSSPRSVDVVVARGFGPPDATLRMAARCVRPGGRIVISEPPEGDRWQPGWLAAAGAERLVGPDVPAGVAVFRTA